MATAQKHRTIVTHFLNFLKTEKKRLKVVDYNIAVGNRYVLFLRSHGLNDNTVGKYLKYTKTIFKDAKIENIQVNEQLAEIKGFSTDTPILYLKDNEIADIENLLIVNDKLNDVRDWLIIGIYIGQRAGDLFRMNRNKIININGRDYINYNSKR